MADAAGLDALVEELDGEAVVGLDTEFHRERTYFAHLALVQLAWEGGIALVDPLSVDVTPLARLLKSPTVLVLHAAEQDLEVLERTCGAVPANLFDTQLAAGFLGDVSPSLVNLVERELGIRLTKSDQLTDWTHRPLSAGQLEYAAGDVAHLLALHSSISERLERSGRSVWVAEECALMVGKDRTLPVPEECWWRLPHSRQLRGPARAVAQCVAAWRELRARSLDLPLRFVLTDLAVVAIAQHPPRSLADLQRVRGLDGRHLTDGAGEQIVAAVSNGLRLAPSEVRHPPATDFEQPARATAALATAFATQRALDLSLDPAILATRADVAAFLQPVPKGRLTTGWRLELVGAGLRRLTGGTAALAFDGQGGLVLEERSHRLLDEAAAQGRLAPGPKGATEPISIGAQDEGLLGSDGAVEGTAGGAVGGELDLEAPA